MKKEAASVRKSDCLKAEMLLLALADEASMRVNTSRGKKLFSRRERESLTQPLLGNEREEV